MRRGSSAAVLTAALVTVGAAGAACTQIGSDPAQVVALVFDSLPYPSVVLGDSLRDETGAARRLRATAINIDGAEIPDAPFLFVAIDTGATVTSGGFVVSTGNTTGSIRIVAQSTTGLQSRALTLLSTLRPDSTVQDGSVDTLRYVLPDGTQNTSGGVNVKVLSKAGDPPAAVRGWIVRYRVEYAGAVLSATDSTFAWLVDESNRRSTEDTTGADGRATRRLRVIATALPSPVDSLVVIATVVARGAPLTGSPVRVVVRARPQ